MALAPHRDEHDYRACDDIDCERFPCRVYREGRAQGCAEGHAQGFEAGYGEGYEHGYSDGYKAGYDAAGG